MASLHYLTVQDILWINLQVTKKVRHFNYARLEEATFYQYAYGESNSLVPQAGRFISGFLRMHPLESGNEATAFVACAAFLKANGMKLDLSDADAQKWFGRISSKEVTGQAAVTEAAKPDPEFHASITPNPRAAVAEVLAQFPGTIQALAGLGEAIAS